MNETKLEADYLVVGAGAMGMAFTDVLLSETDSTVALVDRRARPGGHWNDAYPFVRLHQPSHFYGVNSRPLGADTLDRVGWNKGLFELASGAEVLAYFDQVLHQQFLPSERVTYLPMNEYLGDGRCRSLLKGEESRVEVLEKTVDATFMNVSVPSTTAPSYAIAAESQCVPLNALPRIQEPPDGFVIIGAGKTGMDACLWLLSQDVDPAAVTWIMPRDSWILDREAIQPGPQFFERSLGGFADDMECAAAAQSVDHLFEGLEAKGRLLRLDPEIKPTMYRCATVTRAELEQLRRIENVVRLGRVRAIGANEIVLDRGTLKTTPGTLHVDCSADGLERRPPLPVFEGDHITLQTVRSCQQVFSAAFIAHVECTYEHEADKNELCAVVPHPDSDVDWLRSTLANAQNAARWAADDVLSQWLGKARLNFQPSMMAGTAAADIERVMGRLAHSTPSALERLTALIADSGN